MATGSGLPPNVFVVPPHSSCVRRTCRSRGGGAVPQCSMAGETPTRDGVVLVVEGSGQPSDPQHRPYDLPAGIRGQRAIAPAPSRPMPSRGCSPPTSKRMLAKTPLGRLGEPDDIAYAALFLCSPAASWISGRVRRSAAAAFRNWTERHRSAMTFDPPRLTRADEKALYSLAHPKNLTGRPAPPQGTSPMRFRWLAFRAGSWSGSDLPGRRTAAPGRTSAELNALRAPVKAGSHTSAPALICCVTPSGRSPLCRLGTTAGDNADPRTAGRFLCRGCQHAERRCCQLPVADLDAQNSVAEQG